jgi:hypothetical protein
MGQYITAKILKEMVEAGNVDSVELVAVSNKRIALRATLHSETAADSSPSRILRTTNGRKQARVWASLDRAARFVREDLHITDASLDMKGWEPGQSGMKI